ncbi:MAG: NADH-quinone oxidoreductase subunit N [Cyclobacteriaceae bacterium]
MQSLNGKLNSITESFSFFVPELILVSALIIILIIGLVNNKRNYVFNFITLIAAFSSTYFLVTGGLDVNVILFNGMVHREGFGAFLMILVDAALVLTCLMSIDHMDRRHISEYYVLLLSIVLGCHLLLMSTNLLMVFLSIEMISLSSYVLVGYSFNKAGSEGSLKYFLFGSVSSAIMLYGFSIFYGISGTLDFSSQQFFDSLIDHPSPLLLIAGTMSITGFLFKIAAAPMHPWAPDVYEAAPIPVIAFLSVAPKFAGLGVLTKFLLTIHVFGQSDYNWQLIIAGISMATITFGNFSALWQQNAKRMMAYSSIAQSGFLLVGIAAFLPQGINFMLFYAAIYLLMNFAVFIYLAYFESQGIHSIPSFAGSGKQFISASVGFTVALVALTGLPPTAGFTAKLFVFSALWESYEINHKTLLLWLLVFGLLNTVVSLFFYLRIPYYTFLKSGEPLGIIKKLSFQNLLGFILVVFIVVMFFIPGLLMGLINRINFVL